MDWLLLIAFIVVCECVGIAGSIFTVRAIPTWYAGLKKPGFNPPNRVFGPVWTLLYALQGIAAYLIFKEADGGTAIILFIIQLLLNAGWTPLFFGAQRIGAAFAEIVVLIVFIIITTVFFFSINTIAGWLMIPYLAWSAFATLLNYKLWRLNR